MVIQLFQESKDRFHFHHFRIHLHRKFELLRKCNYHLQLIFIHLGIQLEAKSTLRLSFWRIHLHMLSQHSTTYILRFHQRHIQISKFIVRKEVEILDQLERNFHHRHLCIRFRIFNQQKRQK